MLLERLFGLALAFPFPGQQVVQTRDGQIGDAGQDAGEPGLGVDVIEAGRGDEGEHDGGTIGAALRTCKGPVAPPQGDAAQRSFGGVVAEADSPVVEEAGEPVTEIPSALSLSGGVAGSPRSKWSAETPPFVWRDQRRHAMYLTV